MTDRPLAILDVDGVLVPYGPHGGQPIGDDTDKRLPASVAPMLLELAEHFDLCYCTQWNEAVCKLDPLLKPKLGFEIPYLRVEWPDDARPWQRSKLPAIRARLRSEPDRRVAVFDDHLGDLEEWALERGANTRLVKVKAHIGLEWQQVHNACRWATRG